MGDWLLYPSEPAGVWGLITLGSYLTLLRFSWATSVAAATASCIFFEIVFSHLP